MIGPSCGHLHRRPAQRLTRALPTQERADARRLHPHYIESFFREFRQFGGSARQREPRRYQVPHVPALIQSRDRLDWQSALAVRNHSATGPAWGYGGSGPGRWTSTTSSVGSSGRWERTKVVRLVVEES